MNPLEQILLQIGLSDLVAILPILIKDPASVANLKATLLAVRNDINLLYPGE